MKDDEKRTRPYSNVAYTPAKYEPSRYEPSRFAGAPYVPGATMQQNLIGKINIKDARVAVVGLGYVGLPLAVEIAAAGFEVVGVDLSEATVAGVNRGDSHVQDVASDRLRELVDRGKLRATTDYAELAGVDCVSICVPTPLTKTKEPDISFIAAAVDGLLPTLAPGKLVVLESTTYPGTTEELMESPKMPASGKWDKLL